MIGATEQDDVLAFDAEDGSQLWAANLGTPVPRSALPCGNIDPLGITGTPVIDPTARVIYVNAMTTQDQGTTTQHLIYALSLDDGSTLNGWPVNVNTLSVGGVPFDSTVQNQRGALLLNAGYLYVPYGGHFGDCGTYHGWAVAVPVVDPSGATAWATEASGGGIWAPGGLSSDGTSIFAATGNTIVWTIGAGGTNRLYAYNGETGEPLFNGGGPGEQMTLVRPFSTPIVADGRIFVAADNQLYAFTTQ